MPTAFKEFTERDGQDSRQFDSCYNQEDVGRLVSTYYDLLSSEEQKDICRPMGFAIEQLNASNEKVLTVLITHLKKSEKKYLPFIFTPEIGAAQYVAGILRKTDDGISLLVFNPTGGAKRIDFGTFRTTLPMVISQHQVQTQEKDNDILKSCGPICVQFINFAMQHPDWIEKSFKGQIELPELFQPLMEKEKYQQTIINFRQKDADLLMNLGDNLLPIIHHYQFGTLNRRIKALSQPKQDVRQPEYEFFDDDGNLVEAVFEHEVPVQDPLIPITEEAMGDEEGDRIEILHQEELAIEKIMRLLSKNLQKPNPQHHAQQESVNFSGQSLHRPSKSDQQDVSGHLIKDNTLPAKIDQKNIRKLAELCCDYLEYALKKLPDLATTHKKGEYPIYKAATSMDEKTRLLIEKYNTVCHLYQLSQNKDCTLSKFANEFKKVPCQTLLTSHRDGKFIQFLAAVWKIITTLNQILSNSISGKESHFRFWKPAVSEVLVESINKVIDKPPINIPKILQNARVC